MSEILPQRSVFFELRGVLGIVVLAIIASRPAPVSPELWLLGIGLLLSDLAIRLGPVSWFRGPVPCFAVLVLDVAVLTVVLGPPGGGGPDSLVLYYLTVFVAAVSEDVRKSVGFGLAVGLVYVWLRWSHGHNVLVDAGELMRVPLFFVAAITSGYLASQISSHRRQRRRLTNLRTEFETRITKFEGDLAESEQSQAVAEASERRFRNLVQDVDAIVWEMDPQTFQFTFVSQQAERILGYPVERWLSELGFWANRIIPEDRERVLSITRDATAKGDDFEVEYRVRAADGRIVWLRDLLRVVRDPKGQIVQLRGVMVDITKPKLTEAALRESQERLRLFVEHAPAAIAMVDRDMKYLAASRRWLVDYRLGEKEIIGRSHYELFPDLPDRWKEIHRRCLAGAIEKCEEDPFPRQDGTTDWVHWEIHPWREHTGEVGGLLVFSEVITERKRAEEELNRFFTLDLDLLCIAGFDGYFKRLNSAWQRTLGFRIEELLEKPYLEFVHPDDREPTLAEARKVANDGNAIGFENRYLCKDGSYKWLSWTARPVRGEQLIYAIARDITERKKLEEQFLQAQKMEAVGRLAGGVAHDFNNLLTIIGGYSQLLLSHLPPGDAVSEHVQEIKKAGERAASLTRQLLAFSRQQVLAPRMLDLNAIVANMDKMLQRLIGEDIELVTVRGTDLGLVKADPGQLEQVIMNLAVNSRDAMPKGGKLTIETANVDLDRVYTQKRAQVPPGPYVMLAVSDTGCGMDAETQTRIFEPFFTTKETGKGTGLGLSTVYGIVKQSGGYIWVYSEPGQGATFKIYLPRVQGAVESARKSRPVTARGSETVLVVEDEQPVRSLVRGILGSKGYTVLEASSGEEALRVCKRHRQPIHLLITDVVMPQMGGRELARRLTRLCPGMKVLYTSGYTDDTVVRHGKLGPGQLFLQKPFTPEALAGRVREALDAETSSSTSHVEHTRFVLP
jgi:PAS domain S-box-containing protein